MSTQETDKTDYTTPIIKQVKLDNEISLEMSSNPPGYSNEAEMMKPEYLNNDPFKTNVG